MKKIWDLKNVFSNLELEEQGRGIIMGVTRLLLLGPFYSIQTNFLYFFAHDCTCNANFCNICFLTSWFCHMQNCWHPKKSEIQEDILSNLMILKILRKRALSTYPHSYQPLVCHTWLFIGSSSLDDIYGKNKSTISVFFWPKIN